MKTFDLTRLLQEIATADDLAEVAAILQRCDAQIDALPPREYEQANELIQDAIDEYRQRNKL